MRKGECAYGREIGRRAEDAVHHPTDNESVAADYGVLWYNLTVLSGRRRPIPIDRKRCKAIVERKCRKFSRLTILMQRYAHTPAHLSSYFNLGILQPRSRSERGRFFFLMIARWCERMCVVKMKRLVVSRASKR